MLRKEQQQWKPDEQSPIIEGKSLKELSDFDAAITRQLKRIAEKRGSPLPKAKREMPPLITKPKYQQCGGLAMVQTFEEKHDKLIFRDDLSFREKGLQWNTEREGAQTERQKTQWNHKSSRFIALQKKYEELFLQAHQET